MTSCKCGKNENRYWARQCCLDECKSCPIKTIIPLPNLDSEVILRYHQFMLTSSEYVSQKSKTMKVANRTERVEVVNNVVVVYNEFIAKKHVYLKHRFQIANDKFEWKKILYTIPEFGVIYHMDYSENLSGSPKFEPQDAHFSKKQFTLHCTVSHGIEHNNYIYHISNDLLHDYLFTSAVIRDLVESNLDSSTVSNLIIVPRSTSVVIYFLSTEVSLCHMRKQ